MNNRHIRTLKEEFSVRKIDDVIRERMENIEINPQATNEDFVVDVISVSDLALRKNSNDRWVEFIINDDYLPLMREFPEDYRLIAGYMYDSAGLAHPYSLTINVANPNEHLSVVNMICYVNYPDDYFIVRWTETGIVKEAYKWAFENLTAQIGKCGDINKEAEDENTKTV